ncbi:hypothetical protein [Nocardia cyriacigeorgica]|uniref:Uncharacterized protein n=2 Tax=Nocardia cyriacigeorgica TaxID=135487 RepID=H6R746_NOCCG|nr:hypothetical protein [Nocardia cyriacigeorgica]MBF6424025.1 hypothetical protein [Nocardia cyriacigeorgica]TLF56670.1 hypothetical protein FEK31_15585 [Nocardia cyriacigeorgica]TLF97866.1 hypothetical protein FEK35_26275 [Nocardia cyriacigeorgica]CCF64765.1 protein of unknown function [Nocardia cyriacigeorgica GUH-2]VFA98926.1 Uncharacterised protein [Nocardia cyriacigeorgica]
MFDSSMAAHEIAATEAHPYRVITEPVPYWDDLLLTVYAITTTGERIRVGAIRSENGTRWRWLDKASELPVGTEFPSATDAADAMAADFYTAWNGVPAHRAIPAV